MNDPRPLRCGLFSDAPGCDYWRDALRLRSDFELVALAEASACESESTAVEKHLLPALVNRADVDLIIVHCPPSRRLIWAEQCLRAGKHVLIAPPAASTVKQLRALGDLAMQTGRRCEFWCPTRSGQDYQRALRLVRGGELGDLRRIQFELRQLSPWLIPREAKCNFEARNLAGDEVFAGVLAAMGWPVLDQLLALVESSVASIYGRRFFDSLLFGNRPGEKFGVGADTGFVAMLEFANGAFGQITLDLASTSSRGPQWSIQGTRGSYDSGRQSMTVEDGEVYGVPVDVAAADPFVEFHRRLQDPQTDQRPEFERWCEVQRVMLKLLGK